MQTQMKVVLTIAGSDSGGGAGIQADLKTFASLGVFGVTAITAVTAQNTVGVRGFTALDPATVRAQIDAVAEDFDIVAVKTGMLANAEIVRAVAEALTAHELSRVVVDPVMVAGSGDRLLAPDAESAVRELLVPRATVLTPNVPEACALLEVDDLGERDADLLEAAQALRTMGCEAVFLKGGHRSGDADDLYVGPEGSHVLEAERIPGAMTHGTGCTVGAATAAMLARGRSPLDAVREAKAFVTTAIAQGMSLGRGQGVLHHFWEYYGSEGLP